MSDEPKTRYLVLHDYGMGGLWFWVHARSPREIAERLAGMEVIDDPETVARFADDRLDEADIDDPELPPGLATAREERDAQRGRPGFGALAGRPVVHIRRTWEEDGTQYLEELGPDGRRLRQVDHHTDGTLIKTGPDDWPFNPPEDLYDPDLAQYEITAAEFEEAWQAARSEQL